MPGEPVTLTIDDKQVTVPKGTLIIRAAEQLGIEVPRFCDHPYLAPAGACRQCYVQVEGQAKLQTSCTLPVTPGMIVRTQNTSESARQAQVANLEFLLLNHPLDCPICDRGGECPLQDQALAFGPGESRFVDAKRVFPKPVPLSPLVGLDRERCILCARCTRFCDEISGDRFIELFARSAGERVSIAAGEDFRSPFSGNTIQICPVGALTATPYRFAARPFDLTSGDSVCQHCSAGCNVRVDVRRGEVVRVLARENPDVNDAWICDKGRFAYRQPDAPGRVTTPLIRDRGLEPASFGEVLPWLAERCRAGRVAFLTGGRLMDEDYYALSKLARTVMGTNDLDHRRAFHGGLAEVVAATAVTDRERSATYRDIERASVILVAGVDTEQEVPILHLRIRKAAARGAKVFVVHPRRTRLHDVAEHLPTRPGHEVFVLDRIREGIQGDSFEARAAAALRDAGEEGVVLAGERLAEHPLAADLALAVATKTGSRFGYVTRRANDRGALAGGVHPSLLPGGRRLGVAGERAEVEAVWGPIMATEDGRDTQGILQACADRRVDVLFVIGADPLRDHPDAALARRALANVATLVTDWEGRWQRIRPVRDALGLSRPDWEILAGLAAAMGSDLGFQTLEELHEEMASLLAPRDTPERPNVWAGAGAPQWLDDLTLLTYPLLVDEGRLSDRADELKAALEDPAFAEMHPVDAEKRGLVDGVGVRLTTAAGVASVPLRVTEHVAAGSVFVPFNQPGLAANTLLSGRSTAAVAVETVEAGSGRATGVSDAVLIEGPAA